MISLSFLGNGRQKYLMIVLGILLVAGGGVVWYGYFQEGSSTLFGSESAPPPQRVEINFDVFEDPAFVELGEPRPPIPLPEEVGKRNPFE